MISKVMFWDFDGTLVKKNLLWVCSLYHALHQHIPSSEITLDNILNDMQIGFTWQIPDNNFSDLTGDKWWSYMNSRFSFLYQKLGIEKELADIISLDVKDYVLHYDDYEIYEDAVLVLERCIDAGYRNYILSNNFPELPDTIARLGLDSYFTDYIVSANVGFDKPRIEIFQRALSIASPVETCFMIGDNPDADVLGAKSVGITTLLVHCATKCDTDYQFDSLTDILKLL